ncbi:unnamed protein product [Gordionus sp. m RMFG-2023]
MNIFQPSTWNYGGIGFQIIYALAGIILHNLRLESMEPDNPVKTCLKGISLGAYNVMEKNINLIDSMALKSLYQAYQNSSIDTDQNFENFRRSISMTDKQIFFLRFAQSMCSVETKEYSMTLLKNGELSLPLRVYKTILMSQEFEEVYSCKTKSNYTQCLPWNSNFNASVNNASVSNVSIYYN